jgi:hypothetical protein
MSSLCVIFFDLGWHTTALSLLIKLHLESRSSVANVPSHGWIWFMVMERQATVCANCSLYKAKGWYIFTATTQTSDMGILKQK